MLYNVIVAPIEMIIDWVFSFYIEKINVFGMGGAIAAVSMAINFLALPIYNIADSIQQKERDTQKNLQPGIERIKQVFKGDERQMILATFYKQNNYSPVYALRGSLSILIEVPFFIAAYHFLSHNTMLNDASFLFIKNLSEPDALFAIGSFQINILPILMTVINCISGAIYTKGFSLREKLQVYGMALIFLVLLYNSPSGLVFYWILNNIFSLAKNIVAKTKNPARITYICCAVIISAMALYLFMAKKNTQRKIIMIIVVLVFYAVPFLIKMAKKIIKINFSSLGKNSNNITNAEKSPKEKNGNFLVFIFSCIGMALLAGFVLPSSVISSSPSEFSFLGKTDSPLGYVINSFCVFFGLFVLWPLVIYKMFSNRAQKIMPSIFFAVFITSVINVYVLKSDYGNLNNMFLLDNPDALSSFRISSSVLSILLTFVLVIFYLVFREKKISKTIYQILLVICIAETVVGIRNSAIIKKDFSDYKKIIAAEKEKTSEDENSANDKNYLSENIEPIFHLNKDGKNVVIFVMDRAIGGFLPFITQQMPELAKKYDGFIHYINTVSLGTTTNISMPSILGGYEYSPENLNLRNSETLKDKHNESLLVLPKLFLEKNWSVTLADPPLVNYTWGSDNSFFDNYPEIDIQRTSGKYKEQFLAEKEVVQNEIKNDEVAYRGIKNFSILQILNPLFRSEFYDATAFPLFNADGFIEEFSTLYFLNNLTDFSAQKNTYNFIYNNTTHEPTLLAEDYETPSEHNSDEKPFGDFIPYSDREKEHYHVNLATIKVISKWLDYLKENNCYDNTRIIIVSDHGALLWLNQMFQKFSDPITPSNFNCILLFKDFDSHGKLRTENEFMTSADTLYLARENLNLSDTNPMTGKKFTQQKDGGMNIYRTHINRDIAENNVNYMRDKTQFTLKNGWHVQGDIFEPDNWKKLEK